MNLSDDAERHLPTWRLVLRYAGTEGVPWRSLKVAVIVGTALNLINQGDALFGAPAVDGLKLALTYAMPYAVSTYGAVAFRLSTRKAQRRLAADLPAGQG